MKTLDQPTAASANEQTAGSANETKNESVCKLYRPEHSWLQAFTAFRVPSALLHGPPPLKAQDEFNLRRICQEAQLPDEQARSELLRLLPRAEKFHSEGCQPNAAWGRASTEWPELPSARRLVELFLVWKTASGNLE